MTRASMPASRVFPTCHLKQPNSSKDEFGGNWWNDDNAGSRYANVDNWPDNSNDNLSARGRCDDLPIRARRRLRPRRPTIIGGQPAGPASANTLQGPAERGVGRGMRFETRGRRSLDIMGKRYRNLIGEITAEYTLRRAYSLTSRGKRLSAGYLEFKEYDALNLRIAQQALCLVVGPIFDQALLPRTFASRPRKGTHAGVAALQSDLRRLGRDGGPVYFLKTDFSRYFASIDRTRLWPLIEAKISCVGTLRLLEAMVPRSGIGLPIGGLTSQLLANLYTGATLDRHLQQTLGEKYWYRYMDDIVVLGRAPDHLHAVKESIEAYSRDELGLRFSKWQVAPVSRGVNFLGYRVWLHHKLLRRDSVIRARRKIAVYRAAGDDDRLQRFLAAWLGHARFADTRNLVRSLDVGGAA